MIGREAFTMLAGDHTGRHAKVNDARRVFGDNLSPANGLLLTVYAHLPR